MGVARTAGENLRKNAQSFDLGQIISDAAHRAFSTVASTAMPGAQVAIPAALDFIGGATQAPRVANVGEARRGAVTVELPGVGQAAGVGKVSVKVPAAGAAPAAGGVKAPVYSQAYLDAQPNWIQQLGGTATAAPAAKANNPFDETVARFAAASGGVSLNELAALSDSAYKTSALRTQPKAPTTRDLVGMQLMQLSDQQFTQKMEAAQAAKAAGDIDAAKELQASAVKERQLALQGIIGPGNPMDQMIANMAQQLPEAQ